MENTEVPPSDNMTHADNKLGGTVYYDDYIECLEGKSFFLRFLPSDETLILYVLRRKILNLPSHVPELGITFLNFYDFHPDALANRFKKIDKDTWYFFTNTYKLGSFKHRNRVAGDGYWKTSSSRQDKDRTIVFKGKEIGCKRTFVYYHHGENPRGFRTKWFMDEYTAKATPYFSLLEDCVLIRLYKKTKIKGKLPKFPYKTIPGVEDEFKDEFKDEVKVEVKDEVKVEVKDEVKVEVKVEVKDEVKEATVKLEYVDLC